MSLIRHRRLRSKKSSRSSNPYANQGLDKFAVVLAELADKREQLASHLGVPVPVVKFVLGSQGKWIPIVASSSRKKGEFVSKGTVAPAMRTPEMKVISSEYPAAAAGASAFVDKDLSSSETEQGSAGKGAVGLAKFEDGCEAKVTTLARRSVLVRKWRAKTPSTPENTSISPLGRAKASGYSSGVPGIRQKRDKQAEEAAQLTGVTYQSQLQLTPPSEPRIISPGVAISDSVSSVIPHETDTAVDLAATKQSTSRFKFKFKFLRAGIRRKETHSASSRPGDSTRPSAEKKPSAEQDVSPKVIGEPLSRNAVSTHTKESLAIRRNSHRRPTSPVNSESRMGELRFALVLVIILGALTLGHIAAILIVLGWWYALPCIRNALGSKPLIRTSHGQTTATANMNTTRTSSFPNNINRKIAPPQAGSSPNGDRQPSDYKKKVIMDGLLRKGREPQRLSPLRSFSN